MLLWHDFPASGLSIRWDCRGRAETTSTVEVSLELRHTADAACRVSSRHNRDRLDSHFPTEQL